MALSSSSIVSQAKHDVFLSFRGEDTRHTFTSHLYAALCRKNIDTFLDDELIKRGDMLSPTLLAAIEGSKISVIIFSENYALSTWCLDELDKLIECKNTKGHIVIPLFYHIDPSHVRKQSGSYEDAFIKHEKHNQSKVQKWRMALREASNIAGWDWTNTRLESDFVEDIAEDVLGKLNHVSNPEVLSSLVGIDKHVERVESLLSIGLKNVCIIGIWGMGGIGKTTIAETLFKKYSAQFEGCCFIENVREEWKKQGKKKLQKKLLSKILGDQKVHISTPSIRSTFVVDRLSRRKVLIVLDDVNNTQQVEDLVGEKAWFGPGSRIIVTIRDKDVLKENDGIYKVMQMDNEDALHLFSLKAFQQDQPKCEFINLSRMVVNYAKGNPLALKVLGSLLHSKSQEEWKSTLKKLKRVPNDEIYHVLRLSYEVLDYEEKQIFLDVACCLKGETKWDVINLLDGCGHSTNIGLSGLENKSLITISKNFVQMHDLIQEMGWQIVREESPKELGKRSRLWDPKEICHVLKHKRGIDYSVESILLNMAEIKDVEIGPETFSRMQKLRILKFSLPYHYKRCNVLIPKGLESLPDELRCLHWNRFPLKYLPSSFCPEMLVQLDLQGSLIEKLWEREQDLTNLKSLSLSHCKHLIELPNLSMATNLEEIHLDNCTRLRDVSSSVLSLDCLMALNLSNCIELQCIRSDMGLKSLQWLNLSGCSRLAEFLVDAEKLKFFSLEGTAIEELPSSVGRAKNLSCLHFSECERLVNLPENFFTIHSETLDTQIKFNGCPKLEKLPPISDTSFSITILHLNGCSNLSELPDDLGHLSALHELSMEGSSIEALPPSIKLLCHLKSLNIRHCKRLRFLPELPLSLDSLYALGCISLETVSCSAATALIQNFFSSSNGKLLPRQLQESKGFLHWDRYKESFEYVNCTKLEENVCKAIVADALIRIKYVAYVFPMLKTYAKSDPYHEYNLLYKDFDNELFECAYRLHLVANEGSFPSWSWIREIDSSPFTMRINGVCCSSCMGSYTAFDLLQEQYGINTNYGHGPLELCMNHIDKFPMRWIWEYGFHHVIVSLPGSRVPSHFRYQTTETCITLELPPRFDLLGFAFCLVYSPESEIPPPRYGSLVLGCIYLGSDCCTLIDRTCYKDMISDHVVLWYKPDDFHSILKALKQGKVNDQCINCNSKLSFKFSVASPGRSNGIKECGVWPIYASDVEYELSIEPEEKK